MGEPDLHPERGAEERQGLVDVVAVADEGDHEALEPPEALLDREHVGQGLAGVLAQGQPVDDRDRGLRGELHGDLVRPGPDDDRVHHPLEVAGHVMDALAGAQDGVVGQVDCVAAHLGHAGLEADLGAKARLLEEHGQGATGQRRGRMAVRLAELGLHRGGGPEDPADLGRGQVRDADQVASDQGS